MSTATFFLSDCCDSLHLILKGFQSDILYPYNSCDYLGTYLSLETTSLSATKIISFANIFEISEMWFRNKNPPLLL